MQQYLELLNLQKLDLLQSHEHQLNLQYKIHLHQYLVSESQIEDLISLIYYNNTESFLHLNILQYPGDIQYHYYLRRLFLQLHLY